MKLPGLGFTDILVLRSGFASPRAPKTGTTLSRLTIGCHLISPVTCPGTCNPESNQCENCTADCKDKMCGADQCGDLCPYLCGEKACDHLTGQCVSEEES